MPDQIFVAVGKQIPRLLWNPRFHYPSHKHPLLSPVLSQKNPDHQVIFYFFKISCIVPFMSESPMLSSHCRYSEKKVTQNVKVQWAAPLLPIKEVPVSIANQRPATLTEIFAATEFNQIFWASQPR